VIETGRPVAHVAAEIGVGERLLGRWVRLARAADDTGILARCSMPMNAQSWNVCAAKTPNYVWTVSF
jgi:transposase-like protein